MRLDIGYFLTPKRYSLLVCLLHNMISLLWLRYFDSGTDCQWMFQNWIKYADVILLTRLFCFPFDKSHKLNVFLNWAGWSEHDSTFCFIVH